MNIRKLLTRGNKPYLIRYTLLKLPWFSIKLHKVLISDEGPLHNHPWSFVSIMLRHGYIEESMKDGKTVFKSCKAPCVLYRRADRPHKLHINPERPPWTLVFTFNLKRYEWGFHTEEGFVHHSIVQNATEQGDYNRG